MSCSSGSSGGHSQARGRPPASDSQLRERLLTNDTLRPDCSCSTSVSTTSTSPSSSAEAGRCHVTPWPSACISLRVFAPVGRPTSRSPGRSAASGWGRQRVLFSYRAGGAAPRTGPAAQLVRRCPSGIPPGSGGVTLATPTPAAGPRTARLRGRHRWWMVEARDECLRLQIRRPLSAGRQSESDAILSDR